MLRFLPLVWSGLWRRPGRTTLALVQILLAFALFGILQGWQSGVTSAIAHIDADLLAVHPREGFGNLPRAYLERIRQTPGVRIVTPVNYFFGTYQNATQRILALATQPRSWAAISNDVIVAPADVAHLERTRTGAIVGEAFMRKYGLKVGQKLPVHSPVAQRNGSHDWTFDIVGVFRMKDPDARSHSTFMIINDEYFDDARAADRGMVVQYLLRVKDPKKADEVAAAIDRMFDNSTYETRTEPVREMAQQGVQSLGDINLVIRAIVGAVLFSLLFSIGALLMQSVRERSGELAVLKAIGYSDRIVMTLLVTEAALLCLASAALGLGLAWALFWIAEKMDLWPLYIQLTAPVLALGAGLALLLAALSATLPAWRGLRLPVARVMAGG